jgi:hypothetical protein
MGVVYRPRQRGLKRDVAQQLFPERVVWEPKIGDKSLEIRPRVQGISEGTAGTSLAIASG